MLLIIKLMDQLFTPKRTLNLIPPSSINLKVMVGSVGHLSYRFLSTLLSDQIVTQLSITLTLSHFVHLVLNVELLLLPSVFALLALYSKRDPLPTIPF